MHLTLRGLSNGTKSMKGRGGDTPWVGRSECDKQTKQTRGVSHCGLAIYIKKYLKAREELRKLKYFTMQKYNLQKIL
jgi:hypothetical protein